MTIKRTKDFCKRLVEAGVISPVAWRRSEESITDAVVPILTSNEDAYCTECECLQRTANSNGILYGPCPVCGKLLCDPAGVIRKLKTEIMNLKKGNDAS